MKISPSDSAYQKTPLQGFQTPIWKNVESVFLTEERSRMCLFIWFFSPGVIISTKWALNIERGLNLIEIKISSAVFKWPNNLGDN